jgi:hypothetical protein
MLSQKVFPWLVVPLRLDIDIGDTWEGSEYDEESSNE